MAALLVNPDYTIHTMHTILVRLGWKTRPEMTDRQPLAVATSSKNLCHGTVYLTRYKKCKGHITYKIGPNIKVPRLYNL